MTAGTLLARLGGLLDGLAIPHMVVGSFASSAHGVPRTTQDIDIVIDPSRDQLRRFLDALEPEHWYVDSDVALDALRRRGMFNAIDMTTGWKVDLIVRKATPHAAVELTRRERGRIAGTEVWVATAEDVVIAKLEWARVASSDRQLADVAGIVAARGTMLDRDYVGRWVAALGLEAGWERAQRLVVERR